MNLPDVLDAFRSYVAAAIKEVDPNSPGRSILYHGTLPDDCCDATGTLGVSWQRADLSVQFPTPLRFGGDAQINGGFQLVDFAARFARCWYVPATADLGSDATFARYNGDAALLALIAEHVDLALFDLTCGVKTLGDGVICQGQRWTSTVPDLSGDCAGITWHLIVGLAGDRNVT